MNNFRIFGLALGRRYNRTKKAVGKPLGTILGQNDPISTAEKLARQYGVSPATVKRAGKFAPNSPRPDCRGLYTGPLKSEVGLD